jgi:hypothetical protein
MSKVATPLSPFAPHLFDQVQIRDTIEAEVGAQCIEEKDGVDEEVVTVYVVHAALGGALDTKQRFSACR